MQRIESVEFRRKTSSPLGRRSRAASGIHLYGSHQIEAPYSEIARSKEAPGRPVASAFASTSSRRDLLLIPRKLGPAVGVGGVVLRPVVAVCLYVIGKVGV